MLTSGFILFLIVPPSIVVRQTWSISVMKKTFIALSMALALVGCGDNKPSETSQTNNTATTTSTSTSASTTNATEVINPQGQKVTIHASTNPPFVTKDDTGSLIGFDIEIMQAIARHENLNPNFTPGVWDGALATLDSGASDIVISAVTLNPERAEKYLASDTYVSTPNALTLTLDSPIQSTEDLKGKVIGVERGSSLSKDADKFPGASFREYDSSYLALVAAVRKEIDAAAGQKLHMQYLAHSNPDINVKFLDLPSAYPDKVIMVKKGNTELVGKINSGLAKIKADGTYNAIYTKWFGADQ